MNQFRFAHIEWLHGLWLILALAFVLIVLELRGARAVERMLSPLMQTRLVRRPTLGRRLTAVLLLCGALAALVVALMRPQWGSTVQRQTRIDSQIMVCLDVSRSMLAEDVVPNRLERAKAEIDSLLSLMKEGQQVGLLAFAGKASVLCPLTTDFGFLRLILNEASPATVGLGGTRIGEALTKAVDGFREVGDVNRLILLITDGEDHDSFPLDAAKAAQEKGVRIVSIGFGDELGSKIEVTDPRTGARSYIEDRDGATVISRLDGETLRDIALETQGAYIPAGTGALDWQSIYDAHIAGFLRGTTAEEETVIRNEAYQWCVLVALILLLAALATPTLFAGESAVNKRALTILDAAKRAASWLGWGFALCSLSQDAQLWAQVAPPSSSPQVSNASEASASVPESSAALSAPPDSSNSRNEPASTASEPELSSSPRELYNQAVALVSSDVDRAERLLNAARREAKVDGELRYRALYNLGWVEVNRAQQLLEPEPEQALKHLEIAAGRFREAIRVRPESDDARHNLEIISRRILELSDTLAEKSSQEFAPRLDELIFRIREHQSELQKTCTRLESAGTDVEKYRTEFRQLGVAERQVIADVEKLSADARRHLTAQQTASTNQTSQNQVQTAQLSAMLGYLDSAVQRMHKARSFVRRLQSERAFVRWAAGLTDAKRGRDQLRDPLEILGVLIADATEQQQLTHLMHLASLTPPAGEPPAYQPTWLSDEFLLDGQLATTQRAAELHALLSAGVAQAQPTPKVNPQSAQAGDDESAKLMQDIVQALPSIARAQEFFEQARQSIEIRGWPEALDHQNAGIAALLEAAEVFYDIRRLIDATIEEQRNLVLGIELLEPPSSLQPADRTTAEAPSGEQPAEERAALLASQHKNLQRAERLASLLSQELESIAATARADGTSITPSPPENSSDSTNSPDTSRTDAQAAAVEQQRLELAESLRAAAERAMRTVVEQLNNPESMSQVETSDSVVAKVERPPAPRRAADSQQSPPVAAAVRLDMAAANTAVRELEELQRLFFSVVEHLRETAQRQTELNDSTSQLVAQPEQQTPVRIGPLQNRQQTLERTAQAIADALEQQAAASPPATEATRDPQAAVAPTDDSAGDAQASLTQAAALVRAGGQAMRTAAEYLLPPSTSPPSAEAPQTGQEATTADTPLQHASEDQQLALQKLLEALELLEPPQSQDQNQDQQQPQQQPQDKSDEETESTPQNMDAEQMLQAIREREANRRRERQPQQATSGGGVEKDW